MQQALHDSHAEEAESFMRRNFADTPFADPRAEEQEMSPREFSASEAFGNWEISTPFLPGESQESGNSVIATPELAAFSEIHTELRDAMFREALEQLSEEALEAHAEHLSAEYGDHESRDLNAQRILNQHFEPLTTRADAMLEQFFSRLEGQQAEALTDMEIERIASEVMPSGNTMSPASEQFLGGLLRKARRLVSGAVNLAKRGVQGAIKLAGQGLSALGKLALGPLLKPLKALAGFLLKHVVKYALGHLPPTLRPLAEKLSSKLFQALGETHEEETEAHEHSEAELLEAAPDIGRLEAEFDVQAAQLLVTPDEMEVERLVSAYGEGEAFTLPMGALDNTRTQLARSLSALQAGDSAQPVMEQFVPALLWPAAKTAITILGRPKLVAFIARLLGGLVKPLVGAEASNLLSPAIADAGLRIFGLETSLPEARAVASEALASTIEETIHSVSELPPHLLENETLLTDAVREAFESAASSYFPNSMIRPELRESMERHGMWMRMPARSGRKRYARYSDSVPVEIPARLASIIPTFGNATVHDHLRDHYGHRDGRPYRSRVTLYQALPGTRGSTIARAEGFPASQLHPLTPHAAAALLGTNASLGMRPTPGRFLVSPNRLHIGQRLYRIEPPTGRRLHVRTIYSEILINLPRNELRLWLYLSEPLAQQIAADLSRPNSAATAFGRVKPLLHRSTMALKMAVSHHHLPPEILIVSETPNLHGRTPHWLRTVGHRFGAKVEEWAQGQLAQFFRNNAQEFMKLSASREDGVTLRITMTQIPGLNSLRLLSEGKAAKDFARNGWPAGTPAFQIVQRVGYAINRMRD